jgi:hypothetical protein
MASADAAQSTGARTTEPQEALASQRERAEALDRDLASARAEIEALRAELTRSMITSADTTQAPDGKFAARQEALARERERAEALDRDLTLARSEIEALKTERTRALIASVDSAHVVEAKGTADQDRQDQGRANLASGPAMVRPAEPASAATTSSVPSAEQKLLTRADSLLESGDISGARLVLEYALEAGSGLAAFRLAETYDPRQLSRWRAHGVRGDWAKAQTLYARALSKGIGQAKERVASPRN